MVASEFGMLPHIRRCTSVKDTPAGFWPWHGAAMEVLICSDICVNVHNQNPLFASCPAILASGDRSGSVKLWNARTGKQNVECRVTCVLGGHRMQMVNIARLVNGRAIEIL